MTNSDIAHVLGRLPSGLFVITTRYEEDDCGMLTSWAMQAGFEPPMITIALNRQRELTPWLTAGGAFVLNLLADDQQWLVGRFSRGFQRGAEAFADLNVARTDTGLPALADSLGFLECRPTAHIDSGDHRIFLAEVTAGRATADGQPYVHIRKNGLRY